MNSRSNKLILLAVAFLLNGGTAVASTNDGLFSIVPSRDAPYAQLRQLEDSGLLPDGASRSPLTRLEVAQRIFLAEKKIKEIVVAQADMDLPPPPADDNSVSAGTPSSGGTAASGTEASSSAAAGSSLWNDPKKIAEAEKNLKSLQEAYQFELGLVKDQKSVLGTDVSGAQASQFDLWKSLKGVAQYPSISIHGLGRAFGISQQYYGATFSTLSSSSRYMFGYLDLEPTGSVSKEVRWSGVFRLGSLVLPSTSSSDFFQIRRVTLDFSPDFMFSTIGDFEEAYTPLTLWNRNNLDLFYKPEMVERFDDHSKYENFLNHEPYWPFRGIRVGTAIGWPESSLLEQFKFSTFAHMIQNGFADGKGWYAGANIFTDYLLGANSQLKLKKWYVGGASVQFSTDVYGVLLDEPVDTTLPGSPYQSFNPTTWAHQYLIGSLRPTLTIEFGGDFYVGAQYEGAFSSYQDDKFNNARIISDYALIMSPFVQLGDSKITFNLLNVGPSYYSPLAQTRQDNITSGVTVLAAPDIFYTIPRSQFFLSNVPRAGGIFSAYDRTQDNTFPYGLATPNRQGVGVDVDIQTLKKKSLKIRGAAYLLQEISGNLVVNGSGNGFTGLDPAPDGSIPVRNFTYVNFGPSFDLGPSLGLETPMEIGTNVRYELTTSSVGTLNSFGVWGGLKVGFFDWWEAALALGEQSVNGTDEGINGSTLARFSYLFDNSDLGKYSAFNVNGTEQSLRWSTTFKFNRNSRLFLDYSLTSSANFVPYVGNRPGTLNNQFMEMTYEVEF
ncbi:MAG TPA: hypothetical protein VIJ93_10035 [bacterium]